MEDLLFHSLSERDGNVGKSLKERQLRQALDISLEVTDILGTKISILSSCVSGVILKLLNGNVKRKIPKLFEERIRCAVESSGRGSIGCAGGV